MTANFQEEEHGFLMFEYFRNLKQPELPLMVMEFWTGWFDHWGEKHSVWKPEKFEKLLRWVLNKDASVNFYMFHGGTNFGFWNGANEDLGATNEGGGEPYTPTVTSYDYDCPLSESGALTPKYHKTRDVFKEYFGESNVMPRNPAPAQAYGEISCVGQLGMSDLLSFVTSVKTNKPVAMEELDVNDGSGQGYGFTLYRANVGRGKTLKYPGKVKDRLQIILNGKEEAVYDWKNNEGFSHDLYTIDDENVIDILNENCGRVNYADFNSQLLNQQRKGLMDDVFFAGEKITSWEIFPLDFSKEFLANLRDVTWQPLENQTFRGPLLRRFVLNVDGKPSDTYVSLKNWNKGIVIVNGFNLGRYWKIGPQQTLYLPGPLLHQGENELLVFELHEPASSLQFSDQSELGEPQEHKTVIPQWAKLLICTLRCLLMLGSWVWYPLRFFLK